MTSLLRQNPGFGRLWLAGGVSLVGDWLSLVAVATLAVAGDGGVLGLALVFAAHALPAAIVGPFAGAIVDSYDRRRVLVLADALAAAVTVAMTIVALAGMPAAIAPLVAVRSAITALVKPGESAAVRRLVRAEDLIVANALIAGTWSIAFVVGMALGGVAAMLGPALALAIDAATFAIAAGVHATLPALPVARRPRPLVEVARTTPRDTLVALRVAARDPRLLTAVLGKMPLALAGGAVWIALNMIAIEAAPFGAAAISFGVLQAIRGAGTGIGPATAARLVRAGASERRLQRAAVATTIVGLAALAVVRSPVALAVTCLALGIGTGTNWVLSHASLQRHAGPDVIGRLAAFDELLVAAGLVSSAFVAAAVIDGVSLAAGALAGSILAIAGVVTAATLVAGVRRRALVRLADPTVAQTTLAA